jgi:hypothetical protein
MSHLLTEWIQWIRKACASLSLTFPSLIQIQSHFTPLAYIGRLYVGKQVL